MLAKHGKQVPISNFILVFFFYENCLLYKDASTFYVKITLLKLKILIRCYLSSCVGEEMPLMLTPHCSHQQWNFTLRRTTTLSPM